MVRTPLRRRALLVTILTVATWTTACSGIGTTASPNATKSAANLPGGRIIYGAFEPSGVALFTTNADGSHTHLLLGPELNAQVPFWSPDGRRISVVLGNPQGVIVTAIVNPDGYNDYVLLKAPDGALNFGCSGWSPDGSRVACGRFDQDPALNGIYTARATDGGDLVRVTTAPPGSVEAPSGFSPDGSQILFLRQNGADDEHLSLMIVNVDGSNEHAVTEQQVGSASWSPDGTTILAGADQSLLLVPVDGGPVTTITFEAGVVNASRAAWSPDGEWIVFTRTDSVGEDIYIVQKDGTDLRQVTNTPNVNEEFGGWGVSQ